MLQPTLVTNKDELVQIHKLNQKNLKQNLTLAEQKEQGFITWLYSIELLEKMHELAPSVVVKDGDVVAGYALTTLKESASFHPDFHAMFEKLASVQYRGKPLYSYSLYCMGQLCVAKEYRGKGIVEMLYQKHKELYSTEYDFILTEISTRNYRSIKAHEKVGFRSIHRYTDEMDEWDVVVWNWA